MHPVNFNFSSFEEVYSNRDYFIKNDSERWESFFDICHTSAWKESLNISLDDVFFNVINNDLMNSCVCSTPGVGTHGRYGYRYIHCGKAKICWRCAGVGIGKTMGKIPFQNGLYSLTMSAPQLVRIRDSADLERASAVIYPELIKKVTDAAKNSINGGAWIAKEIACISIKRKLFNLHIHAIFKGDVSLLEIDNWKGRKPIESIEHLNNCIRYVHKPLQDSIAHKYRLCYDPSWGKECNIKTQEILQTLIEGTHGVRKFTTIGSFRRNT